MDIGRRVVVLVENDVEIDSHRSGGVAMKTGIDNALVFELVRQALAADYRRRVSSGLASVRGLSSLDWFKESTGFRRLTVWHESVILPLLRPFVIRPVVRLAGRAIRRLTRNDTAFKVAATLSLLAGDTASSEQAPAASPEDGAPASTETNAP